MTSPGEARYGRLSFALQFMLDTSLSDADRFPLKLSDLLIMDLDEETCPVRIIRSSDPDNEIKDIPHNGFRTDRLYRVWDYGRNDAGNIMREPWEEKCAFIDPSGRGQDEAAMVILYRYRGYIAVAHMDAFMDGYSEATLSTIMRTLKRFGVRYCRIESNFGDGMFTELLKPYQQHENWFVTFEEERATTQKELRIIDALEPVMNQHRLIIDPRVLKWDWNSTLDRALEKQQIYRLAYQMTHLTNMKGCLRHDDRLDALASGVAYFTTKMAMDGALAERQFIENAIQEDIDRLDRIANGWMWDEEDPHSQSVLINI